MNWLETHDFLSLESICISCQFSVPDPSFWQLQFLPKEQECFGSSLDFPDASVNYSASICCLQRLM